MELLWDILRGLGILKRKKKEKPAARRETPASPEAEASATPVDTKLDAIEKQSPEDIARAIKRMLKKE